MMRRTLWTGIFALFLTAGMAGAQVIAVAPPPPPREVVPVAPAARYVWVPGYYRYYGHAYAWVPGRYVVPPHHHRVWVPGYWGPRGGGYVWVKGYWR